MEYKPGLPEHNDNISHTQPVREFFLLCAAILVFLTVFYWALGLLVDVAVEHIPPKMEAAIFSPFANLDEKPQESPQQTALQKMVDNLSLCASIQYPLTVKLVESEQINAFAVPGGGIFVYSGLLDKLKSDNGLAFVLAHELAHFSNRDHLRGLGRGIVLTALMAAITGGGSDITQLFAPATGVGQAQFSQKRESLADQQALLTLNCYYGHAGGATEFFDSIKPLTERSGKSFQHYFASHPEAEKRIENLNQMIKQLGFTIEEVEGLSEVFSEQNAN